MLQPEQAPPPTRLSAPLFRREAPQRRPGAMDGTFGLLAARYAHCTNVRRTRRPQSCSGAEFDERRCSRDRECAPAAVAGLADRDGEGGGGGAERNVTERGPVRFSMQSQISRRDLHHLGIVCVCVHHHHHRSHDHNPRARSRPESNIAIVGSEAGVIVSPADASQERRSVL